MKNSGADLGEWVWESAGNTGGQADRALNSGPQPSYAPPTANYTVP